LVTWRHGAVCCGRVKALACLNHLVTNALLHMPDCLEYMSRLRTPEVFRFCAIPQVMAIATLDKVFDNPDVFTGVVKIRKGLACKLILESSNMAELRRCFSHFATRIAARVDPLDPNAGVTLQVCRQVVDLCGSDAEQPREYRVTLLLSVLVPVIMAACAYSISRGRRSGDSDVAVWGMLLACVVALLTWSAASVMTMPPPPSVAEGEDQPLPPGRAKTTGDNARADASDSRTFT
jgi:hypothetical protein